MQSSDNEICFEPNTMNYVQPRHIVSSKKFLRISSSPHQTLPNDNYDAPEEVGGDRKYFDSPIRKLGLI